MDYVYMCMCIYLELSVIGIFRVLVCSIFRSVCWLHECVQFVKIQ